ncbi:MAG: hypothetical protein ACTSVI_14395 [Promethearchaeota archaeon]
MTLVRYFFLFENTPFPSRFPLKALTSTGKRLDVIFRMIIASLYNPSKKRKKECEIWIQGSFQGVNTKGSSLVRILIKRERVAGDVIKKHYISELVLAKYLARLNTLFMQGEDLPSDSGLQMENHDVKNEKVDSFLIRHLKKLKEENNWKLILLHETGRRILKLQEPNVIEIDLEWANPADNLLIIVGNHEGFPNEFEEKLLHVADQVISINIQDANANSRSISYLGSHVIEFLNMLLDS